MDRFVQSPAGSPLLFLLFMLIPLLVMLLIINLIDVSFAKLGLPPSLAFFLLFGSLLGSFINIPIKDVKTEGEVLRYEPLKGFGWFFPRPVLEHRTVTTTIAANVGGAVLPVVISVYLLLQFPRTIPSVAVGTAICVVVCHRFAQPIPGMGIGMPLFVAPLTSALVAVGLSLVFPGGIRTVIAYTSGVLGVLIGADLLNLNKIKSLGAPTASIGGAGTFDGIFLTGILAVLLV
ncbi:MAG: DUF1614 domain-containing protein [Theionarchaea archaeon]|nr:DUF1614 domain-containing protein [Theionarchaea archaeon]MBU7037035.1 DUF1614 domain-containing protein [Theionarchaea archaeon]